MIDANSRRDLFGVRLAQDGAAIDANPVLLTDLGSNSYLDPNQASYGEGAIGFDGKDFGVFFYGVGTVRQVGPPGEIVGLTSVPTDGPPLQPATEVDTQASFSMAQTSLSPPTAATSDGTRFVVVYPRNFSLVGSFSLRQVDGAFVTVTGGSVEPPDSFVIAGAFSPPVELVADTGIAGVANNGSATVAAWLQALQNVQTPAPPVASLEAALIAPDEVTLIHLSDVTTSSGVTKVARTGRSAARASPRTVPRRRLSRSSPLPVNDFALASDGERFLLVIENPTRPERTCWGCSSTRTNEAGSRAAAHVCPVVRDS